MKVYRLRLVTVNNKFENLAWFRGNVWGAITKGQELAEEKSKGKKEEDQFTLHDVERIK